MKRIIFYAAAVGIFVSSVLAKPARGAAPVCAGSLAGRGTAERMLTELRNGKMNGGGEPEWFPGQGPELSREPETQEAGAEWFPGQGPEQQETQPQIPEVQKPDIQIPGVQDPWADLFPWFSGQGGNFWQQGGSQNGFWWWNAPDQESNSGSQPGGGQSGSQQGGGQSGSPGQTPGTGAGGWEGDGTEPAAYVTRIVELVNVQRAAAGLSPVTASAVLSAAADVRAQEIVGNFSHYRPNGTYFNTVLDQRGISYNGAGENIAYGYDTPERVMTEWMNSASHRANILDSRYTKLGVGYYEYGGVKYWTQMFTY